MGTIQKVVIDTNVFISAFGWGGTPEAFLSLLEQGKIENYTTPLLLKEIEEVLHYSKLERLQSKKKKIMEFILCHSTIVTPTIKIEQSADPDDNRVLECAVESGAAYIVSGDKDLLRIEEYQHIKILTASDFLKVYSPLH